MQNRRTFIRNTAGAVAALGAMTETTFNHAVAAPGKSVVSVVRNDFGITDRGKTQAAEVKRMLDTALFGITGKSNHREVWAALGVTEKDVVAIKLNCNSAGYRLFVHSDLVDALTESLMTVVPENNIIIYERYSSELERAGFTVNTGKTGIRCHGTDRGNGFHSGEGLSRILTDVATKVINIPTLKAFGNPYVGSLFLKNHIGSIPPSDMPRCHRDIEMITRVNDAKSLRDKTVLGICDGLQANYKRGVPWYWKGIIVSTDQVAAERVALDVINDKLRSIDERENPLPFYVKLADTAYGLGTVNSAKMTVIREELKPDG